MTPRLMPTIAIAMAMALGLAACGSSEPADPTSDEQPADESAELPVDPDAPISGACLEGTPEDECLDNPGNPELEPGDPGLAPSDEPEDGDAAAGSCLVGDEDCTDESFGGQDVTTVVPVTDSVPTANTISDGTSSGATGRVITAATVDGTSLRLVVDGGACDVLEDVLVDESPEEVRVLVLTGQDADVDMCTQEIVSWAVDVELDAELGSRTLLDLAG